MEQHSRTDHRYGHGDDTDEPEFLCPQSFIESKGGLGNLSQFLFKVFFAVDGDVVRKQSDVFRFVDDQQPHERKEGDDEAYAPKAPGRVPSKGTDHINVHSRYHHVAGDGT